MVKVCGYLADPASILEAEGRLDSGLYIDGDTLALGELLSFGKHLVCLEGRIRDFRCRRDKGVCLAPPYRYGIKVRSISPD